MSTLEQQLTEGRARLVGLESSLRYVRQLEEEIRLKETHHEVVLRQKITQYNELEVENEGQNRGILPLSLFCQLFDTIPVPQTLTRSWQNGYPTLRSV
jgi:hypothetical protein